MNAVMNKVRLGFLILGLGALIFFMLVRLPSSIEAQSEEAFGDHTLKGAYGFTLEGVTYLTPPSDAEEAERVGPSPFNILGQIVADGKGQIAQGVRTVNFDGEVSQDTVTGTYAVNSDGTGTLELTAFFEDEPVAVEEFDCFFTQPGNQFECAVTSVTLIGEEPLPEVSWVALATGLQQSTDIPEPTASAVEDLIGTWEVDSTLQPLVIEYNEDGTYRAAGSVWGLDSFPYHVGEYRLEGTSLTFDTGDGPGDYCRNQSGTYQIELTEEGQYTLELQEDPCEMRALYFVLPWSRRSP